MSTARRKRRQPSYRGKLRRASLGVLGFLLLLVFMHGVFGPYGYLSMRHTQSEVERLRGELRRLRNENAQLSGAIQALKNDPEAIERAAREDMGLARPGELIFSLPDEAPATSPDSSPQTTPSPAPPAPQQR
jgi:cell division protein FtsB